MGIDGVRCCGQIHYRYEGKHTHVDPVTIKCFCIKKKQKQRIHKVQRTPERLH